MTDDQIQQQRDDFVRMQERMGHLIQTVEKIELNMVTEKDLKLLATKAQVDSLTARVEELEKQTPGALFKTLTGWAIGLTAIGAAIVWLVKLAKSLP